MLCWRIFGSKFLIVSTKLAQRKNIRVHLRCLIIKFVKHFMHSWQEQKSALEIFTRIYALSQARLFILKTFPWLFPCIKNTQGINFISNFSIVTQKRKVGTIAPKKFIARLRKEKIEFDNYMQQVRLSTLLSIRSLVEGLFSSGCSWISNFPYQPHQRNYCGRAERRLGARCEPQQSQDTRHDRELDNLDQWNIPGDHRFVTHHVTL